MKALNVIEKIFGAVIIIIVVSIAFLMLLPKFFGFQPYAVISGSMVPKYSVGSVVYVKSASFDEINVGDSISFNVPKSNIPITHQVIYKNSKNNTVITKGIANAQADGLTSYSDIIGKASNFCIPYVGYAMIWLSIMPVKIALITFFVVFLIIFFFRNTINKFCIKNEKNMKKT